ncbi:hypothetical protein MalM25_36420 [Planctomycetes bacterium MalM25]|nr:hypothetical protein MalM25_36420 [Planctomycetes bacterium MalM25]
MVKLVRAFGFKPRLVSGSHHIFGRDGVPELINLQNAGGEAKPYQINQFLQIVERHNLTLEENA